jgi:phage tail-like protein
LGGNDSGYQYKNHGGIKSWQEERSLVMPIIGSFFTKTARIEDPFATFKFHVEIGNIIEAAFTECAGLEMSTEVFELKEGGENQFVHKFPGRTIVTNVVLKKGFTTSNELFLWFRKMEECLRKGKKFDYPQVTITLFSSAEQSTKARWVLNKAFPVKWVGPSFKSDEAAVAVESLEIAHHGILIEAERSEKTTSKVLSKLWKSLV